MTTQIAAFLKPSQLSNILISSIIKTVTGRLRQHVINISYLISDKCAEVNVPTSLTNRLQRYLPKLNNCGYIFLKEVMDRKIK